MSKFLFILTVCCFSISMPLYANDTSATIAAGVITYTTTDNISMDKETLKISPDKITVTYKFTNHSSQDITSDVAFPLPPSPIRIPNTNDIANIFPSWDEVYHAYSYINGPEGSLHNIMTNGAFIDFERFVNGTKMHFDSTIKAVDSTGQDITKLLRDNNIPLSSLYISGFNDESQLAKNPVLKQKLTRLKLLDKNDLPIWQTQIIYHWKQYFPAKKTIIVSHSYRPYVGYQWLSPEQLNDKKTLADYNISSKNKHAVLAMFSKKQQLVRLLEVWYILSTGANWKGPIKSFSLEITPAPNHALILTTLNKPIKKTKSGNYIINISNFKPDKDLKVLWFCNAL